MSYSLRRAWYCSAGVAGWPCPRPAEATAARVTISTRFARATRRRGGSLRFPAGRVGLAAAGPMGGTARVATLEQRRMADLQVRVARLAKPEGGGSEDDSTWPEGRPPENWPALGAGTAPARCSSDWTMAT